MDLHYVGVEIEEEDQAIILLSSLSKVYEHIVDTMLYGKETLTMTEVKSVLNSKELPKKNEATSSGNDEGSNVRGRHEKKENNKKWRGKSKSKSRQPNKDTRKCYKCKKECHIRRFCSERIQKKEDASHTEKGDASIASDGYG